MTEDINGSSRTGASTRISGSVASSRPAGRNLPPQVTAVCQGTKTDGGPCRAPGTVNGQWCGQHDPRTTPEMRQEWARRGGMTTNHRALAKRLMEAKLSEDQVRQILDVPDLGSADKVNRYIERLVGEVKAGLLPPSLANAIRGLLEVRLKVEEMNLSAQLAELEAELERPAARGPRVVAGS